jgi:hypothetical protein
MMMKPLICVVDQILISTCTEVINISQKKDSIFRETENCQVEFGNNFELFEFEFPI